MKKLVIALLSVVSMSAFALEVVPVPSKDQPKVEAPAKVEVAPVVKPEVKSDAKSEVKAEVTAPSKSQEKKKGSEKGAAPVSPAVSQPK